MGSTPVSSKSLSQVRPRRLPTLIKVLTGYDDEPYWNGSSSTDRLGRSHTPVIAYIDKPKFEPSQQKRKRRVRSDDTIQIAAAAAATAVWSQSLRSFGSCRMNRVNAEWDAALRWIAGWDSTTLSGDVSLNEWANHFVDDLTTVLEACIEQCSSMSEDSGSTHSIDQDDLDSFGVMGSVSSALGHVLWRSIFGWVFGNSLRLSASFGRLDTVMQITASTVAVYAIHSLWSSGWPMFADWVRTLRYTETPDDWLIQHEKELELAKSSRARQKKRKKSKKKQKQWTPTKKYTPDNDAAKDKSSSSSSGDEGSVRVRDDVSSTGENDDIVQAKDWEHTHIVENRSGFVKPVTESSFARDSVGSSINDGVPSVISLSSAASVTSSPSIKPSSPSPSNVPENEALDNNFGFGSPTARSGLYSQQLPRKNAFAVPTVEQRNEAANQLRDFQNAQIRRLVLQKQQKLAQDSKSNHLPGGDSSAAKTPFGCNDVSGQMKKPLKPPPGFSEFIPVPQDRYHVNLDENELLLSKLLDDDDDEVEGTNVSLPVSAESSLDPSATPFFVPDKSGIRNRLEPRSSKAKDQWSGNIKGVYGGNVW
jgi:hypothetical protein